MWQGVENTLECRGCFPQLFILDLNISKCTLRVRLDINLGGVLKSACMTIITLEVTF